MLLTQPVHILALAKFAVGRILSLGDRSQMTGREDIVAQMLVQWDFPSEFIGRTREGDPPLLT